MNPPSSAVSTPTPISGPRTVLGLRLPEKTVQYTRPTATAASASNADDNMTQTGVGATASASAVQKWKGTTAAFTNRPPITSTKAATTKASGGAVASARPIGARPRASVRA